MTTKLHVTMQSDDKWFQYIANHSEKPWDYGILSSNPNITWDMVKTHPDKEWNYSSFSYNPNITWDIIQANPDKPWNYYYVSSNPNITWDIVEANPDKPWDYEALSRNQMSKHPVFQQNQIRHKLTNMELFVQNRCKCVHAQILGLLFIVLLNLGVIQLLLK